ncbi:hypothetical protein BDZ97DRAFT_490224 [Flammula alnicola]|nr:hypothetical protein BDZ97DRAFT_490224 [Flammula alnicola]
MRLIDITHPRRMIPKSSPPQRTTQDPHSRLHIRHGSLRVLLDSHLSIPFLPYSTYLRNLSMSFLISSLHLQS